MNIPTDIQDLGDHFDYEGYYPGSKAHCLIKVNGNAVICTQAPDNEGLSITNGAEKIATEVCRQHRIPFNQLVWIEHYIHSGNDRHLDPMERPTWDFVTFDIQGDHLAHPRWRHAGPYRAMQVFANGGPL